ncbi:hypothetical protein NMY22_g1917 [Coprinellus aureogranulatus]|nr:hypothetical protein NMY22_g1917 [Coprinellus aureogranulatus]
MLFWPIPWKLRPLPPLDPTSIRRHPELIRRRYHEEENYKLLRSLPLFQLRDTPLGSLYRLQDAVAADSDNDIMLEGYYFFHRADWKVKDIPDPQDPDPVRYALLASIVEHMVVSYNWKISLGIRRHLRRQPAASYRAHREEKDKPFEEAPAWAAKVPALPEWVSFYPDGAVYKDKSPFGLRHIAAQAMQLENI